MISATRKQSLYAVLAALALALALALGTFASPASAQAAEECPGGADTFLFEVQASANPQEESQTVDINGVDVTITYTVGFESVTFETDPPTVITIAVKSGQNPLEFFTGTEGTFNPTFTQDISHVTFCVGAENGTTTTTTTGVPTTTTTTGVPTTTTTTGTVPPTTTTTTGTVPPTTTTGTVPPTTTGTTPPNVPPKVIIIKKPGGKIVKVVGGVVVKKGGVKFVKVPSGKLIKVVKVVKVVKKASASATATPTAKKTVTATAPAKAQYAQYKQYATPTALPETGGSGPVLPIAVGALLFVLGSGLMVLKAARSSS